MQRNELLILLFSSVMWCKVFLQFQLFVLHSGIDVDLKKEFQLFSK